MLIDISNDYSVSINDTKEGIWFGIVGPRGGSDIRGPHKMTREQIAELIAELAKRLV